MSVPVVGPLSVTPLYAASGDRLVWWDGVEWWQIEVSSGVTPPPTGGAGVAGGGGVGLAGGGGGVLVGGGTGTSAASGGAPAVGGGDAPLAGGGDAPVVGGGTTAAVLARIGELEARLAALEGAR